MLSRRQELRAEERLWSVDWHPEGRLIATVGEGKEVKLWSTDANGVWSLHDRLTTEHTKSLRCVRFSHNGKCIAVASFDSTITIFIMAEEGYEELTTLQGHQNEVKCVDWSPCDRKIASCSRDKNVWIWAFNQTTYEYECENVLEGHAEDVKSVLWIDEASLVSASYDNTIRYWAQDDDDFACEQVLQGHKSIVWGIAYEQSTKRLYSCSEDQSVTVWQRAEKDQFRQLFTIDKVHAYPIYCCNLLRNGLLITGGGDNCLAVIKIHEKEGEIVDKQVVGGDVNSVRCRNNVVASCGDDEVLTIWEYQE